MSTTAEIADNKWEVEASKPPVSSFGGILQIVIVTAFAGMFAWMLLFTVQGIFGTKRETLADQYGHLKAEGGVKTDAPAAPAEAK
jgi:hypothetical protein